MLEADAAPVYHFGARCSSGPLTAAIRDPILSIALRKQVGTLLSRKVVRIRAARSGPEEKAEAATDSDRLGRDLQTDTGVRTLVDRGFCEFHLD